MNSVIELHQKADAVLEKDSFSLGEAIVFSFEQDETTHVEAGDDLKKIILEAKAGSVDPLEAVERTLKATVGCGFKFLMEQADGHA